MAFATASASGKFVNPDGSAPPQNSEAHLDLHNCGNNYPQVSGASIGSHQPYPLSTVDGTWSGQLYRNDEISCNLVTSTTWWTLTYWVNGRQIGPSRDFICSQATCVFDGTGGLTPITVYPPPTPPAAPTIGGQSFQCAFPVAASTWTCTHNFGTRPTEVQFRDLSWNLIVPDNDVSTDVNTETGTFLQPQAGYMLVLYTGNFTPTTLNPNYLISNPTADQAVTGDHALAVGGSLSAKRIEGCRQVDGVGFTTILAALSDIGLGAGCVEVTAATTVSSTTTVPTNVVISNKACQLITVNNLISLNLPGGIQGPRCQMFTGTGTVAQLPFAYPEWWLANASPGTTDMAGAIQSALAAVYNSSTLKRGPVVLGPYDYLVQAATLNLAKTYDVSLIGTPGQFQNGTRLIGKIANKPVIDIVGSSGAHIENILIYNYTSTLGILMGWDTTLPAGQFFTKIKNVTIVYDFATAYGTAGATANSNLGTVGIANIGGENVEFENLRIQAVMPLIESTVTGTSWVRGDSASTYTFSSQFATLPASWTIGAQRFIGNIDLQAYGRHRPALAMNNANTLSMAAGYLLSPAVGDGNDGTYRVGLQVQSGSALNIHCLAELETRAMEMGGNVTSSKFFLNQSDSGSALAVVNLYGGAGFILNNDLFLEVPSNRFAVDVDGTSPFSGSLKNFNVASDQQNASKGFTAGVLALSGFSGTYTDVTTRIVYGQVVYGGANSQAFTETATVPSAFGTLDVCYPDSSAHAVKCSYNGGSFFNQTQTIGSGTVTTAGTAVTNGTSQAQTAITITGALTTDVAQCSLNAAMPATWQTGIQLLPPVVTANTVTIWLSNPTAGNITPAAATVRCTVTR